MRNAEKTFNPQNRKWMVAFYEDHKLVDVVVYDLEEEADEAIKHYLEEYSGFSPFD